MRIAGIQKQLIKQRARRVRRVRAPMLFAKDRMRLSIFRSHKYIYAQIIDDEARTTIVAYSDSAIKEKMSKTERAKQVGTQIAQQALSKNVREVVFDRGWYKFHGRVKLLAEAAREAGLQF